MEYAVSPLVIEQSLATSQHVGTERVDVSLGKCLCTSIDKPTKIISSGKSIQAILASVAKSVDLSDQLKSILTTLIRVFVTFSLGTTTFENGMRHNRFVSCFVYVAMNLVHYHKEGEKEQQYVKYWVDKYLAQKGFKDLNEYPLDTDFESRPLFNGFLRAFIRRHSDRGDISFFYSLQKGAKQAWPELPVQYLIESLEGHRIDICGIKRTVGQTILDSIARVSKEVFGSIQDSDLIKLIPSGSACAQASRKLGGAMSLFSPFEYPTHERAECKVSSSREDSGITLGVLRDLTNAINSHRQELFDSAIRHFDDVFHQPWGPCFDEDPLRVSVVGIPEPGKFRIISKGDGYLYTALQPLQGAMLGKWKSHPAATMRDDDLTCKVNKLNSPHMDLWASVDYKSATDKLSREASFAALSGLPENLRFKALALYSLQPGTIKYPNVKDGEGNVIWKGPSDHQINGQLMGHPLSFPLLCVINLSVWRHALTTWAEADECWSDPGWEDERYRRMLLKKRLWNNVLINGDDMIAKTNKSLYDHLMVSAKLHGFCLSPGKNYLSERAAMMNSQVFVASKGRMIRKGYLNQRIVTGVSPKSGESKALPTQIGAELSKMVDLCPRLISVVPETMKRWSIKCFGTMPNWYLPVHLGGYGVDIKLCPTDVKVTRGQRILAAHFLNHPELGLHLSKRTVPPVKLKLVGAKASARAIYGDYVPCAHESSDEVDPWTERLMYLEQMHSGIQVPTMETFERKFRRDYRLSPMKLATLAQYWIPRYVFTTPPVCPPLLPIRGNIDKVIGEWTADLVTW